MKVFYISVKLVSVAILTTVMGLLGGCSTVPGHVSTTASQFDGEKQVHVNPGWLYGGVTPAPILLGGFWSSKAPSMFKLEVVTLGFHHISELRVNIDGQIFDLKPSDSKTSFTISSESNTAQRESSRHFAVPLKLIQKMTTAKRVICQLHAGESYVEGNFSFEQITYAKSAFIKALSKIQAQQSVGTAHQ